MLISELKTAPEIVREIKSVPPPSSVRPAAGGVAGAVAAIIWDLVFPEPVAKTDLASVQQQLGYAPNAPVTVEFQIPQNWYGGQNPNATYTYRYERADIANGNLAGWTLFTTNLSAGVTPPFTAIRLLVSGVDYGTTEHWAFGWNGSGNPPPNNTSSRSYTAQVQDASGQWKNVYSGTTQGHRMLGFPLLSTGQPDGTMPPPIQSAVIAPPAPDVFIAPQPTTPQTPAPQPAVEPSTKPKEPKKAPAPLIKPYTPAYPDINPTPAPAPLPGTEPTPDIDPDQIPDLAPGKTPAPAPAPGTNPGKTTRFIPGATPLPVPSPLPPGTQRNTRFLPPADNDTITIREPYTTPKKKEEPKIAPLPLPIPIPPIPAKIDCKELKDCLGEFFEGEDTIKAEFDCEELTECLEPLFESLKQEPETASLPLYQCDEEEEEGISTEIQDIQVPPHMAEALELLFSQFQPLIKTTCQPTTELTTETIEPRQYYSTTNPNIEFVRLVMDKTPGTRYTLASFREEDYTYLSGYFSWTRQGIRIGEEIKLTKAVQMFKKPDYADGFTYHCIHSATVGVILYIKITP